MESVNVEYSNDELVKLIKYHVERKLYEYHSLYGVDLSYELRDSSVIHTYKTICKKYLNDGNFETKKEKLINLVIENYISKKYLEKYN